MENEIEAKFYPVIVNDIVGKIEAIGATLEQPRVLMKRSVFSKHKNPHLLCTYARVRDEGGKVTMSLKTNASEGGHILDQKELQIEVNSFDKGRDLLKGLGLQETGYQQNYRTTWVFENSEIVLDEWPALDPYIEIESPSVADLERLAALLNLDFGTRKIIPTDELYAEKYGISKQEALDTLAHITFDAIPTVFARS